MKLTKNIVNKIGKQVINAFEEEIPEWDVGFGENGITVRLVKNDWVITRTTVGILPGTRIKTVEELLEFAYRCGKDDGREEKIREIREALE